MTGTDTEVGKTLISGALITHLKKQHAVVAAFKPVVAGLRDIAGKMCNEDILALSSAMNYKPQEDFLDICPYQLSTPAAPHLVAKESDVQACVSEFRKSPAVRRASGLIRVIGE